jgi:hypothetical protein
MLILKTPKSVPLSYQELSSQTTFIDEVLNLEATQSNPTAGIQEPSSHLTRFRTIKARLGGDQSCYSFAMSSDKNFFTILDPVKQSTQFIFGFERPDLTHITADIS